MFSSLPVLILGLLLASLICFALSAWLPGRAPEVLSERADRTKARLVLIGWVPLIAVSALMPLQWPDPNRLLYVAAGGALLTAQIVRCIMRWKQPPRA